MNNYALNKIVEEKNTSVWQSIKKLLPFVSEEKKRFIFASLAVILSSALNLIAPVLIGHAVDTYIQNKQYGGVLLYAGILLVIYLASLIANYFQTILTGTIGQNLLFNLRNAIFKKIQSLPIAFFNQNKAGDLISRINNDTDKLNVFFSQGLVQLVANILTIIGAGIFVLFINWRLGLVVLAPAFLLLIFTQIISPWIKKTNALNLKNLGMMSAEISESIGQFKVIVAFNRRDYFCKKFNKINSINYDSAIKSGVANNTLTPIYGLASNVAQLAVVAYGIYLISIGNFTIGLLISFIAYVSRFYDPLRQVAAIWSNFQVALASWERIYSILSLESDLVMIPASEEKLSTSLLEFKSVHFRYPDGKEALHDINFKLERGKTYALVGPTGGGKTTTASIMSRLYDPSEGMVLLDGRDIRSYQAEERTQKIGFILQEPFLFTGTVKDNILYGNNQYKNYSDKQLEEVLEKSGLEKILKRFDEGLATKVSVSGATQSIGQKQLIAFMRAILRNPEILILDEATANIDTVTEQLLDGIIKKLSKETTRVIIAHRLNTIENADEIFFVNNGEIIPAGSMEHAIEMLLHGKRDS